jgi:protein-S-isoprenylcysteine O-methyltransferase Ste14
MKKPMTRWGIGPLWALFSIFYGLSALFATWFFPFMQISDALYPALNYLGMVLLLMGIPYFIASVIAVTKAFNAKELITRGVYGICRHPLYGSWIVFIVPGIVLLRHSWFGLTAPVVMYLLLRRMVVKEEDYLAEEFGEDYLKYKKRVPLISPLGWLKR